MGNEYLQDGRKKGRTEHMGHEEIGSEIDLKLGLLGGKNTGKPGLFWGRAYSVLSMSIEKNGVGTAGGGAVRTRFCR